MSDVVVPKLNNNDQSYTLVEWLVSDGQLVRAGDPLVELETSKAVAELAADVDGVVHRIAPPRTQCRHGDVIARLYRSEDERQRRLAEPAAAVDEPASDVVITEPAIARAAELGIGIDRLRALGRPLVRRADVDGLLTAPDGPDGADAGSRHRLPRTQSAVAAVVSRSHRTIPAASAVIKVDIEAALRVTRAASIRAGTLIGLPELLVQTVAAQRDRFGLFFATPLADGGGAEPANVGVTVDVGSGLFLPVVREAEQRSLPEIAELLQGFRTAAAGPGFTETELSGMNIMLSLNNDPDVVMAIPIVHPDTTAAVCLAGIQHELVLDGSGAVASRHVVNISVSYDHRVINGRDAMLFLQAIKYSVEYPDHES